MVDAVFQSSPETLAGGEVVVGVWAFALQIYGDFSGYSSIAQGIAKWLGFDLMYNFRMPYLATSPSDFWRRWHISLSRWLRDYLYVSIGGNRKGRFKTYRNLLITMVLGGLWHGAGGTYLAWGLFHGLLLCAWRPFREGREASASPWGRALRVVLMFQLVCVGWLLFRAASIEQAWIMASQVVLAPEWTPFATYIFGTMAFYTGPLLALELWFERRGDQLGLLALPIPVRAAAYLYFILMLWFFPPERLHAFIYFQF